MNNKTMMSILPEFPFDKELDLENTFIRIDDDSTRITYKVKLSKLIKTIKKEISKN